MVLHPVGNISVSLEASQTFTFLGRPSAVFYYLGQRMGKVRTGQGGVGEGRAS